jgi:hypothetical protein
MGSVGEMMALTMNLHFPEFPDHERNGRPCRGLADDTQVGDYLLVDGLGAFVISTIEGENAILVLTNDWVMDGEPAVA